MPGGQGGGPVPLLLTAKTDAGIADYDVFLLSPPQVSLSSYDELRLVIRRNGYQQVAVYSVIGVPLILGHQRIEYVLGYQVLIRLCAAVVAYDLNLWYLPPAKTSNPAPASARTETAPAAARLLKRQPRLPHNGD